MKIFAYAAGMLGIVLGLQAAEPIQVEKKEPISANEIMSMKYRRAAVRKQHSFEAKLGKPENDGIKRPQFLQIPNKSNS